MKTSIILAWLLSVLASLLFFEGIVFAIVWVCELDFPRLKTIIYWTGTLFLLTFLLNLLFGFKFNNRK